MNRHKKLHTFIPIFQQYDNNELRVDKQATAEEVLRITRTVTEASKRATSMISSSDQEQVIAAANFARQAVAELLATTLSAANNAENVELKFRTIHAGREVALQVKGKDENKKKNLTTKSNKSNKSF